MEEVLQSFAYHTSDKIKLWFSKNLMFIYLFMLFMFVSVYSADSNALVLLQSLNTPRTAYNIKNK